jgi:putative holliday junction resolvase
MRTLAIDYGAQRVGLAISDAGGIIAQPLGVLRGGPHLFLELRKIIEERLVARIVLGYPLNIDQSAGPAAQRMEALAAQLRAEFNLPVFLQDERLTSEEAEAKLREMGIAPSRRRERRDAIAAALILQAFLAEERR